MPLEQSLFGIAVFACIDNLQVYLQVKHKGIKKPRWLYNDRGFYKSVVNKMEVIAGIHIFPCGLPALDCPQTSTVHGSLLPLLQYGFSEGLYTAIQTHSEIQHLLE